MTLKIKLSRVLGWVSLVTCGCLLLLSWSGLVSNLHLGIDGSVIILMLAACSYAIVIGAGLLERDHPSAGKIFPSCIVAYGLVLLIFHYWFQRL